MPIEPGQSLLHYRLVEKIGEGGMGVVWRAVDGDLDRDVAIKILPDTFSADGERRARFEREAKLLASLNHPGIATIHGLHRWESTYFLAMELVPGEDLAARLARGPVSLEESLDYGVQIAEALEAAHQSGVVHRDLKPANVLLTPDGKVKLLDFGLAKAVAGEAASSANPSMSPTLTSAGTVAGMILGTAAYMSPEQARGQQADARSDVWAFGVVLFEMLTGRQAFGSDTVSDSLAAVLKVEPDWDRLPTGTPPRLIRLLKRCLNKKPADRLHSAADARIILEEIRAEPAGAGPPASPPRESGVRRLVPWVVAAAMTVIAVVGWLGRSTDPRGEPAQPTRLSINLPAERGIVGSWLLGPMALSPDGRHVFYASVDPSAPSERRLCRRSLDTDEVEPIAEVRGVSSVFVSPDGESVAFAAADKLHMVPASGGAPVEMATAEVFLGGGWLPDGGMVVSPGFAAGLVRIPPGGGEAMTLTEPDRDRGEVSHRWPVVLPGGRAVLFTIKTDRILDFAEARIGVVDVDTGDVRELIDGGTHPAYLPTGHLVYSRGGTLLAVPFDAERLEVVGRPVEVLDSVAHDPTTGIAMYAVSSNGTLVYVRGTSVVADSSLAWVDRDGNLTTTFGPRAAYQAARLSPDGGRIATMVPAANNKLWVVDLERDVLTRLTFGPGNDGNPIWSPDGDWVYYRSDGRGQGDVFRIGVRDGREQLVSGSPSPQWPDALTSDGGTLIYTELSAETGLDLWMLSLEEGASPEPFLRTEFDEEDAALSPDGSLLLYESNETGRRELYVRRFPDGTAKVQLTSGGSSGGGRWSREGREIIYSDGAVIHAVSVEPGPRIGRPQRLFEQPGEVGIRDVSADGQRFLAVRRGGLEPPDGGRSIPRAGPRSYTRIEVVLDWSREVEGLVR